MTKFLENFTIALSWGKSKKSAEFQNKFKERLKAKSKVSILCSKSINSIDTKFFRYLPLLQPSHFCTINYLKRINLWSPLAPLLKEIGICVYLVFCKKCNSQQLLFEQFFATVLSFGEIISWIHKLVHFPQYSITLSWFDTSIFNFRIRIQRPLHSLLNPNKNSNPNFG